MKNKILALVLSVAMIPFTAGCTYSQFEQVLNEVGPAVSTILQIIALVKGAPVNSSLDSKVKGDVAALEKLMDDFKAAHDANKKVTIKGEINADFQVLNSDLNSVFVLAQVSDKNTQAKLTALVGLIESAVQIAMAAVPGNAPSQVVGVQDVNQFVGSYNAILTAKTGNKLVDDFTAQHRLHVHGKLARVVSFGKLN